jgi:hypothetical protein
LRLLSSDPFDQRDESQLTKLHDWWEDLQPIVVDALPSHTIIEVDIDDDLPVIAVPPATLAQVLINLVMNSRQAMERTAHPKLTLAARVEDGKALLDVVDNGSGMDAETRRRCFEPYFTTRARGYATGLGLSTGRALLNGYGGDLMLGPVQDVGTMFTLSMPTRVAMDLRQPAVARRVRLLVRDPRQLAMLRLLIRNRGLEEIPSSTADAADLTICDVDELPILLGAGAATGGTDAGDIIAIGTPRADIPPASIRWVDPRDFSLLDDVLH